MSLWRRQVWCDLVVADFLMLPLKFFLFAALTNVSQSVSSNVFVTGLKEYMER